MSVFLQALCLCVMGTPPNGEAKLQPANRSTIPKCNPGWFMFDFLLVTMGVAEAYVGIVSMACNMPDGS